MSAMASGENKNSHEDIFEMVEESNNVENVTEWVFENLKEVLSEFPDSPRLWRETINIYDLEIEIEDETIKIEPEYSNEKPQKTITFKAFESIYDMSVHKITKKYNPVTDEYMSISSRKDINSYPIAELVDECNEKILSLGKKYGLKSENPHYLKFINKTELNRTEFSIDKIGEFFEYIREIASKLNDFDAEKLESEIDVIKEEYKEKLSTDEIKRAYELTKSNTMDLVENDINQEKNERIGKEIEKRNRKKLVSQLTETKSRKIQYNKDDDKYLRPYIDEDKNKVIFYEKKMEDYEYESNGLELRQVWKQIEDHDMGKNMLLVKTIFKQKFMQYNKSYRVRKFLVGESNGKVTLTQVPKTTNDINEAVEYTKNYETREYEEKGYDIQEFGDYYIRETKRLEINIDEINKKDDDYTVVRGSEEDDYDFKVTHPFYGEKKLTGHTYKLIKKKSAQRKERLNIKRYKMDRSKYKEKYIGKLSEKKKKMIDERIDELIEYNNANKWNRYELLEPEINKETNKVSFKEPCNYCDPSRCNIEWVDYLDGDEDFLLFNVGFKAYWHGSIWGTQNRTFLAGLDDGNAWFHQVPKNTDTIEQALDYMKPKAVERAENNDAPVKRQGDIYFVQTKRSTNMSAIEDTDHDALVKENSITVKHPEHNNITLKGTNWKAIQNNTASRPSTRGRRLAD